MAWGDEDDLIDVFGAPALTRAPVNLGAEQAQSLIHVPHTRNYYDAQVTFLNGNYASIDNSVIKQIDLSGQIINYFVISPSAMNFGVGLGLQIEAKWVQLGAVYRPLTDYYVASSQSSLLIRVPTRRSYSVHLWLNTSNAAGFNDATRLVAGYLPDWEHQPE